MVESLLASAAYCKMNRFDDVDSSNSWQSLWLNIWCVLLAACWSLLNKFCTEKSADMCLMAPPCEFLIYSWFLAPCSFRWRNHRPRNTTHNTTLCLMWLCWNKTVCVCVCVCVCDQTLQRMLLFNMVSSSSQHSLKFNRELCSRIALFICMQAYTIYWLLA